MSTSAHQRTSGSKPESRSQHPLRVHPLFPFGFWHRRAGALDGAPAAFGFQAACFRRPRRACPAARFRRLGGPADEGDEPGQGVGAVPFPGAEPLRLDDQDAFRGHPPAGQAHQAGAHE